MVEKSFEHLLVPIAPNAPCGEEIRYGDEYDEIQEARREDDPNLPQGVWKTDIKRAQWSKIITLCEKILAHKSKDLQIVGWYIEAKLKHEGLAGLIQGVYLFERLVENYWDTLYPHVESPESDARLQVLEWLNERIPERIYEYQVAEKIEESDNFVLGEWVLVSKNQTIAANKIRLVNLREGITRTDYTFYQEMKKNACTAKERISALTERLKTHDARADGILYKVKSVLEELESFTDAVLRDICPPPSQDGKEPSESDDVALETPSSHAPSASQKSPLPTVAASSQSVSSALRSREDAYAQLTQVLTFLAAHEPHNPMHFLLRKAVSWTHLELGQIMKDIMRHSQFYQDLFDQFRADESGVSQAQTGRGDPGQSPGKNAAEKPPTGTAESSDAQNESKGFYPIQSPQSSSPFKQPPSFKDS